MNLEFIKSLFLIYKEPQLYHRYITNNHIIPLLKTLNTSVKIDVIGKSVLHKDIFSIRIGYGKKRILMWSQMHGNESTTTKAIFDVLNTFTDSQSHLKYILEHCTLCIIPILSPDGAETYTRVNANNVDLNRDAQALTQPESILLKNVFNDFKPHYCFNLHGQRTIFSAGIFNKPATVSFLAPAQDKACTITENRKIAMEIIVKMNDILQLTIPNQVGIYDDAFNLNCVGDMFQSQNVPTILFEAGHYANDYQRETTRFYMYVSLISALDYISKNDITGYKYEPYLQIPQNKKLFYDVIIRDAKVGNSDALQDIGILFKETLVGNRIDFMPKIEKIENLNHFYAHKEINANGLLVLDHNYRPVQIHYENDFVIINNEKIALKSK